MTELSTNRSPTSIATAETSALISSSYSTSSLGADTDQHKFSNRAKSSNVGVVCFIFFIHLSFPQNIQCYFIFLFT